MKNAHLIFLFLGTLAIGNLSSCNNDDISSKTPWAVSIATTDPVGKEGDNNAEFTIVLNKLNETGQTLSFGYSLSGSANQVEDYEPLSNLAVIPSGSASVVVAIDIKDDSEVEGIETVVLILGSPPVGIILGQPSIAEIIIEDND